MNILDWFRVPAPKAASEPLPVRAYHKGRLHGTVSKYNGGCRCDECRSANSAYYRKRREAVRGMATEHGTVNSYTHFSCRCDLCRAAHTAYQRTRRTARAVEA